MFTSGSASERVIEVSSWVGIGTVGIMITAGIISSMIYAFGADRANGLLVWMGAVVLVSFGVLFVVVTVAAIANSVARSHSRTREGQSGSL